jgi:hypothetical protein
MYARVSSAHQPRTCFQNHVRRSTGSSNLAVRTGTRRDASSRERDMRRTCLLSVISKADHRNHHQNQTSKTKAHISLKTVVLFPSNVHRSYVYMPRILFWHFIRVTYFRALVILWWLDLLTSYICVLFVICSCYNLMKGFSKSMKQSPSKIMHKGVRSVLSAGQR